MINKLFNQNIVNQPSLWLRLIRKQTPKLIEEDIRDIESQFVIYPRLSVARAKRTALSMESYFSDTSTNKNLPF